MLNKILIDSGIWFLRLISWIPLPITRAIGYVLGHLSYLIMYERRRVGLINLRLCFPEKSDAWRKNLLRQHFSELFTIGLSYGLIFGASKKRLCKLIKLRNFECVEQYYSKRPVILLAPHFLALDIGANRLTVDLDGYSIFSQQRNYYLSERVKAARLRFMEHGGEIFSRQEGLRQIIKKMKITKLPFYYLPDQDMDERSSIYVPFFAHPYCATLDILPKLCELSDAVVISMATYREGNHYVVEFSPIWEDFPSDNLREDVIRMNQTIEQMVMKHPSQYLWLHKRFKTQPNLPRGQLYK